MLIFFIYWLLRPFWLDDVFVIYVRLFLYLKKPRFVWYFKSSCTYMLVSPVYHRKFWFVTGSLFIYWSSVIYVACMQLLVHNWMEVLGSVIVIVKKRGVIPHERYRGNHKFSTSFFPFNRLDIHHLISI
jgi:hypothetical protein